MRVSVDRRLYGDFLGSGMQRTTKFALVAALTLHCTASSSSATTINISYAGTVFSGTDFTGVFGQAGTLLDGAAYTLVYTFDTAQGRFTTDPSTGSELSGGPGFGPLLYNPYSSSGSAALTINGRTVSFVVSTGSDSLSHGYSQYLVEDYGSRIFTVQTVYDLVNTPTRYVENLAYTYINDYTLTAVPTLLTTPYDLPLGPGIEIYSGFRIVDFDRILSGATVFASGELLPTSVSVSTVPVPAALIFFVTGLGALGLLGSRRTRKELRPSRDKGVVSP
jgi:hypothetical protein